jgi:hypothetical protein
MHVAITASVNGTRLDVAASLTGDGFPNAELILQDAAGNRQMLFTFETTGAAHTGPMRLMGDPKKPMNSISKSFPLDDSGLFAGAPPICGSSLEVQ